MAVTKGDQRRRKNYQLVGEQARRISACGLTFLTEIQGGEMRQNGAFVQNAITLTAGADERQRALWQDRVRLDDGFWRSLKEHPVPVREEAVKAIGARSLALDVYIWLAYRLHALSRATPVTWTALHAQFGAGFKVVRQLKPTFREALALALAVYPEAKAVAVAARGRFPVKTAADTLGVARSNRGDDELLTAIRQLTDARPTYGHRQITALLNRAPAGSRHSGRGGRGRDTSPMWRRAPTVQTRRDLIRRNPNIEAELNAC